ncbi:MAG TPA: prepilin-type N-terminal cleavage/methylation domain-containing protein [Gemmatimonadales bacterium]|nr:prepilin-type N-terminal cleavage/methylation domain-containing protein [Gemmatimonadales bacterium]
MNRLRGSVYFFDSGSLMGNRGYSLTELVLAMVIVGMVALIATPRMASQRRFLSQRSVVNEFIAAQSLATATAVRRGRVAELHIDAAARRYWIEVDTSMAGGGVIDTVGPVRQIQDPTASMSSTRTLLCYDAQGLATTVRACEEGDATVMFSFPGYSRTIEITLLGKLLR